MGVIGGAGMMRCFRFPNLLKLIFNETGWCAISERPKPSSAYRHSNHKAFDRVIMHVLRGIVGDMELGYLIAHKGAHYWWCGCPSMSDMRPTYGRVHHQTWRNRRAHLRLHLLAHWRPWREIQEARGLTLRQRHHLWRIWLHRRPWQWTPRLHGPSSSIRGSLVGSWWADSRLASEPFVILLKLFTQTGKSAHHG